MADGYKPYDELQADFDAVFGNGNPYKYILMKVQLQGAFLSPPHSRNQTRPS